MSNEAKLSQSVRWGENYVSSALNKKLAGVIPVGIYEGFRLKAGGNMAVLVEHDEGSSKSVAIVERDGFSLTVNMSDPGLVEIPAPGKWFICIEAFYARNQQGYQRIVAREMPQAHHIVIGVVDTSLDSTAENGEITEAMISYEGRKSAKISLHSELLATQSELLIAKNGLLALQTEFAKLKSLFSNYHPLCELHLQLEPDLKDGFEVWDGGEIENGAELYPEAWEYLQTTEGQKRCISAAGRQELRDHVYYTLADGTEITYGGIGGVPYYTIDTATGKILMPDIRGQHLEMAGFNSLNVGAVAIDQVRGFSTELYISLSSGTGDNLSAFIDRLDGSLKDYGRSVFYAGRQDSTLVKATNTTTSMAGGRIPTLDLGRNQPVGTVTRPRSLAVLACSYMGMPTL